MAHRAQLTDLTPQNLRILYDELGAVPVDEETYVRIALDDPDTKWELHDGLLLEKPGVSFVHFDAATWLSNHLAQQIDLSRFRVAMEGGRLRRTPRNYFIPDIAAVPVEMIRRERQTRPTQLGVFDEALPLVVEVWSPSTGRYDVDTKIPRYKERGDLEIWRLHPTERTLTVWRRQPDGSYAETVYHQGVVEPSSLPGVTIDLDALLDFR